MGSLSNILFLVYFITLLYIVYFLHSNDDAVSIRGRHLQIPRQAGHLVNNGSQKELGDSRSSFSDSTGGKCRALKAVSQMRLLYGDRFKLGVGPFVSSSEIGQDLVREGPPYGFKGMESELKAIIQKLPAQDIPDTIKNLFCSRCVVVGNGGIILNSSLGKAIDEHDVVIRLNKGPVASFEKDVGRRTTIRLLYPESSTMNLTENSKGWLMVVVTYKSSDLHWAEHIIDSEHVELKDHFWARVATSMQINSTQVRILNPLINRNLAADLIGEDNSGKKMVPTIGATAIALSLQFCDEISVAGFGYSKLKPHDPVHYYEHKLTLSNSVNKSTSHHHVDLEVIFLKKLVKHGVIKDLTSGLT